jgi:hypothetical protein
MAYHRNNSERRLARLEAEKARSEPPAPPPTLFEIELEGIRKKLTLDEMRRLRDLCRDSLARGYPKSFEDPINGVEVRAIFDTARARADVR